MNQNRQAPPSPRPMTQPVRDPLHEYVWGADAARLFGVVDAASVWRQIVRHAADYPGEIEVIQVGRRKMVKREHLVAFTRWFAAGPGRLDKRIKIGVGPGAAEAAAEPVAAVARPASGRTGAVTEERRAWLREQIAQRMQ